MWWLIPVVIVIFVALLVVCLLPSKDNRKHKFKPKGKELEYSNKVKNYQSKSKAPASKYIDTNGKRKIWYDDSKKGFKGEPCFLNKEDRDLVKQFVTLVFPENEFDQSFIETKINYIYNCKEQIDKNESLLDSRCFFMNEKYTIFPFHRTLDKRFQQILYYCQTRSLKVIELPETIFSKGAQNYIAYFDNDCFDQMCFLSYMMNKYPMHEGNAINGFESGFKNKNISDAKKHDKEYVFEYIYRMMNSPNGEYFPRKDADAETIMRLNKAEGYPPPTEHISLLAEITAEMEEKGIISTNYKNKNERKLFFLVKEMFPDAIYQYKEEWLGIQSVDIYIPSLKIGIEYQGDQHYRPVKFYGGKEGFEQRQKLDEEKKRLCLEHQIKIIEWKYETPITKENLIKFLNN